MPSGERRPLLNRDQGEAAIALTERCKRACWTILIAQGLERLAFYSLSATLTTCVTNEPFCWTQRQAVAILIIFRGTAYTLSLFGGWISDSYIPRFFTIIIGYSFYIIGYATILTANWFSRVSTISLPETQNGSYCTTSQDNYTREGILTDSPPKVFMLIALCLVALAAGMVHINLATFGGEQVRELGTNATRLFFTSYYWAVSCGDFVTYLGFVILIRQIGCFYGYLISGIAAAVSLLKFTAGQAFYITVPAGNSDIFVNIIKIVHNAYQVKRTNPSLMLPTFVDYANVENPGGKFNVMQISDIKLLRKVLVTFLLMVPYWICYSSINGNLFLVQGYHLRVDLNGTTLGCSISACTRIGELADKYCNNSTIPPTHVQQYTLQVPPSTLLAFSSFVVLVFLPLVQRLYLLLTSHGVMVFTWRRLLCGMVMAALALIAAGILENRRLDRICQCGYEEQLIDGWEYYGSRDLHIWWQIPQYCLFGFSEILFFMTGLEYAYMEAPRNMQGILMGLYFCAIGVGYFIGVALPSVISGFGLWSGPKYVNCSRLDFVFFILAAVLLLCAGLFWLVAKCCDLGLNRIIIDTPDSYDTHDANTPADTPDVRRRLMRNTGYRDSESSTDDDYSSRSINLS